MRVIEKSADEVRRRRQSEKRGGAERRRRWRREVKRIGGEQ